MAYMTSDVESDHRYEKHPHGLLKRTSGTPAIFFTTYISKVKMQTVEENMKENNVVPAHHPSSLNIHTFNNAKFHIQAQRGAMC